MAKIKLHVVLGIAHDDLTSTFPHTPSVVATMDETLYDVIPLTDYDEWVSKQKAYFCGEDRVGDYAFREIWVELDGDPLRELFATTTVQGEVVES
jgi:hypothetical protein